MLRFFLTLPLLSLPLWGLSPEAALTQMDALRLLAKSRAADGKCKILPAGEAEELGLYLARAEVAAATRNSVSEIQSSAGKALGDTATCRSLAEYRRQVFAYYVERRCEYLSRRGIRAFWVAIIREHRAALSAYGRPAVASTVRRAEARASEMECGAKGRQLVRAEYANLARN